VEVEGNRVFEIHPDPRVCVGDDEDIRPRSWDFNGWRLYPEKVSPTGMRRVIVWRWETMMSERSRVSQTFDPDVILSDHGDASLFALLFSAETRWKISIPGIGTLPCE